MMIYNHLKAVKIFKSVFLLSLFLLWLICFLALDDSPLLKLQQEQFTVHPLITNNTLSPLT